MSPIASRPAPTLERQLASATAWWGDAGVDSLFLDDPRNWLGEAEARATAAAAAASGPGAELDAPARLAARSLPTVPEPPAIGGPPAGRPRDLPAFASWWLTEPSLDCGGSGPRVAPRGDVGAALMVLVPMPEADDGDALLSGRQGQMVGAMLAAMGVAPDCAYLAAALPRHMAQPDWEGLGRAGLGEVLLHHLALARPRRLLVLGHGILPLLGHNRAQSPAQVNEILIHEEARVPVLVGYAPDRLLDNARARAILWRQWLDWTQGG